MTLASDRYTSDISDHSNITNISMFVINCSSKTSSEVQDLKMVILQVEHENNTTPFINIYIFSLRVESKAT